MTSINQHILQQDILEEQYFTTHEFQRGNKLIEKLTEMQYHLLKEKADLQTEIMSKNGVDDE
jgi:hypothetical protein